MISVIIPTYNREKTIMRSVQSVLNQTYKDIELIIVDDCSTDNTKNFIANINDARIKYFCLEKNSGACAARNYGIEHAAGELIAFQDSDDEWVANKLELQLAKLQENDAEICVCPVISYDTKNKTGEVHPKEGYSQELFDIEHFLGKSYVSTQVILGYSYCFNKTKFDITMPRLQDWDLCLRLIQKYKFCYCNTPLVRQYIQEDSITKNDKKALDAYKSIYSKYHQIFERYPEKNANMLERIGFWECRCKINPLETFERAYEITPTRNLLFKIIFSRLKIIRLYYFFKYRKQSFA